MRHVLAILLALPMMAACGGAQHAHGDHAEMTGPLGELHAVLAPIWHADKGPARVTTACNEAKLLRDRAVAVQTAPPPAAANAHAYGIATNDLVAAGDGLTSACAADGRPDVEAKLEAFHDAFHKIAGMGGGHHEP